MLSVVPDADISIAAPKPLGGNGGPEISSAPNPSIAVGSNPKSKL
jgi:hypothetical protein